VDIDVRLGTVGRLITASPSLRITNPETGVVTGQENDPFHILGANHISGITEARYFTFGLQTEAME